MLFFVEILKAVANKTAVSTLITEVPGSPERWVQLSEHRRHILECVHLHKCILIVISLTIKRNIFRYAPEI
jgi:hypothetical protein